MANDPAAASNLSSVLVLTHHPRETLTMKGGTTFTFVTDGIKSALVQARAAASDKDIAIAGGASTIQQYLAAGMLDKLYLHVVPIVLGEGERLLVNVGDPTLEPVKVVASPAVTHISIASSDRRSAATSEVGRGPRGFLS